MESMQTALQRILSLKNGRSQSRRRSGNAVLSQSRRRSGNATSQNAAPHPIPKGREGQVCPITGLSAEGAEMREEKSARDALEALVADPDISQERLALEQNTTGSDDSVAAAAALHVLEVAAPIRLVQLNVVNRAHRSNSDTLALVRSIGGLSTLRRFTECFYEKSFADPHIDKFIRSHSDPHGERFASWIAEKFGDGTPWTNERKTRPRDVMKVGRHLQEVAFDRSSAHFAAWHSHKREPHKWGQHFKPDDARVWMRLHFWAARETGLFQPQFRAFMDYYIRFIGHFVSVYSSKSPPFTRESARWSANPENIRRYVAAGNIMVDVIDKPVEAALAELPPAERLYSGSGDPRQLWPYDMPQND